MSDQLHIYTDIHPNEPMYEYVYIQYDMHKYMRQDLPKHD